MRAANKHRTKLSSSQSLIRKDSIAAGGGQSAHVREETICRYAASTAFREKMSLESLFEILGFERAQRLANQTRIANIYGVDLTRVAQAHSAWYQKITKSWLKEDSLRSDQ